MGNMIKIVCGEWDMTLDFEGYSVIWEKSLWIK